MLDTPKGSLIAYATSPGQTALDGAGRNSPYTTQLLRQIPIPRRPMELMFKAVRRGVYARHWASRRPGRHPQ